MDSTRKYPRQILHDDQGIPATLIPFGRLNRQDITIHGVDISEGGLGIITDSPIAPGFIWFWNPVSGRKGGMVIWSTKVQDRYRAGIQFLPLPIGPEDYLQRTNYH